jgi:hypothetical protein
MGACDFWHKETGGTPTEAFRKAVDSASWEHGHGGYTGTIAEKSEFILLEVPKDVKPADYAQKLMDEDDKRIADKWGPAGCVCLGPSKSDPKQKAYLFFGYASE